MVVGSGVVSAIVSGWFSHKTGVKLAEMQTQREQDIAKLKSELAGEQARSANARQVIGSVNATVMQMHQWARKDIEDFRPYEAQNAAILRAARHDVDFLRDTLAHSMDQHIPHLPSELQAKVATIRERLPKLVESVAERYHESGYAEALEEEALGEILRSQEEWQEAVKKS